MLGDERSKQLTNLGLCLFTIPVLGWMTGDYVERDYDAQFRNAIVVQQQALTDEEYAARVGSYMRFCSTMRAIGRASEDDGICDFADHVLLAKSVTVGTAALGVLLFSLILGGPKVAGTDRQKMSQVFGPLVRLVMILLAVSVFLQGAIFIYSIYTLEAVAIQRVHTGLLSAVALGVVYACWVLVRDSLGYLKADPMPLRGVRLDRKDHARIYDLVDGVAARLQAEKPDCIIVGLEPNFFVTTSKIQLPGASGPIGGRSLFLSLGMARLFGEDELTAVIGHELGHFRGEDVAYSMKFAPTYARLGRAINALYADSGSTVANFAKIPAVITLSACLMEFAAAERAVGRERELVADRAGAEASSAESLVRALIKISIYGPQWERLYRANVEAMAEGKMLTNLSLEYACACSKLRDALNWDETREDLGRYVQPHPVDTHPRLGARMENLGVSIEAMTAQSITVPEHSAITLLHDAEMLEEQLSALESQWLVATGVIAPPNDDEALAPRS